MENLFCSIDKAEALRYAGQREGPVSPELLALLDVCAEEIMRLARPRLTYRRFSIEPEVGALRLSGTRVFLPGNDIARHLKGCGGLVLMAVTLGVEIERAIRRCQVTDMAAALLLDACASAAVESACNRSEMVIRKAVEGPPPWLTARYSPGYGDLPLALQRPLLDLVDAGRKIGLFVSGSGIMTPQKSVTAIIGLRETPGEKQKSGCAVCESRETCMYRKEGASCASADCVQ